MKYQVFVTPPSNFSPAVEAAGCYCECEQKLLFLRRHVSRPQGETWGVPGGKLEKGEGAREAVVREIFEEVGLQIDDAGLEEIGMLYIRLPHVDYIYHMFRKTFSNVPTIQLALDEHVEFRWVTFPEAYLLPLIAGGKEALDYYQKWVI